MILSPSTIATFAATFGRGAAFMYAAPVISDRTVPAKFRVATAALIAMAVMSTRPTLAPEDIIFVLPAEILVGLAAGFTGRIVIAGAAAGAELIGLQLGLGFAAAYDPSLGEVAMPVRRIVMVLGGLAFVMAGGVEAAVHVMAAAPIPAGALPDLMMSVVHQTGTILPVALRFSAPVLIAAMVTNVAMGLMSRAAPGLNVFSVMLALVMLVGIAIMIATAPAFIRDLQGIGVLSTEAMLPESMVHP